MADAPIIQVDNLSVAFDEQGQENCVVRDVSFTLERGKTLALVGESGSGKSLTALSILQLLPYPKAYHPSGRIRFQDIELLGADERVLRQIRGSRVGMVFQEPMTSLNPLHSIEKQISEVILLHTRRNTPTRALVRERAVSLLDKVGIPNPESRLRAFPHELSGGQRQRVMIAMALANNPEVLIADEPTTALDVTVQAQILALLKSLQQELNMALLMITHDLNIVREMADDVCVMRQGEIVERGTTSDIFQSAKHAYTKELIDSEPHGYPEPVEAPMETILEAEGVRVWFPLKKGLLKKTYDHVKAVNQISLTLHRGETLGIVGESGSGKTTLGMALLRLQRCEGRVVFLGTDLSAMPINALRAVRSKMQVVFQDPYGSLSPRMSVEQIVAEGLRVHEPNLTRSDIAAKVSDVLEEVGLGSQFQYRFPHELSGGQRQRVAIARAMVLKPAFVLLDEPTSALDRTVQLQVIELLRSLQRKYKLAFVFISHDLAVVRALSHRVIVMKQGDVVETGTTEQIFNAPTSPYTRELMKAAFAENLSAENVAG